MKITLTERVYTVYDKNYKRKFVYWANGITIPWTHWNWLHFSNAKKQMVKSFHTALWMFLDEVTLLDLELCVSSSDFIPVDDQWNVKNAELLNDSNSPLIQ